MQAPTYALRDAELLMPLLRVIRHEIRERTLAVTRLEQLLEAPAPVHRVHREDVGRIESELSTQRRELRRVERELAELGCKQDEDRPLRILIPSKDGALACDGELAKTRILHFPQGSRA